MSVAARVEVRLFGAARLVVRGADVEMRTSRVAALLGYLATRGGRGTTRAEIAETLWPGREATLAHQSLRQTLLYLRQALGEEADALLVANRRDLRLRPEGAEIDLGRFRALAARESEADLQRAVELYRGTFLAGIDDGWTVPVRTALAQDYAKVLLTLSDYARPGNPARALELADQAVAEDAYHDAARARRILALRAMGEETRALREYEAYETLLADEFGLRPSPVVEEALGVPLTAPSLERAAPEGLGAPGVFAALESGDRIEEALRLTIAMVPYWAEVGQAAAGLRELDRYRDAGLARSDDPGLQCAATAAAAFLAIRTGHADRALREARASLDAALGDRDRARALGIVAHAHLRQGQMHETRVAALRALRLARRVGARSDEYELWSLLSRAHTRDGAIVRGAAAARRARSRAEPSSRASAQAAAQAGLLLAWAQIVSAGDTAWPNTLEEVIVAVADDRSPSAAGIRSTAARLFEEAGDLARAEVGYVASVEERRGYDDPYGLAVSLTYLGDLRSTLGDHASAVALHQEALALRKTFDDRVGEATSLRGLGRAYDGLREPEVARRAFREAARLYGESHALPGVASCLLPLARLEAEIGSRDLARRLAGRALRLLQGMSPTERATIGARSDRLLPEAEAVVASLSDDLPQS